MALLGPTKTVTLRVSGMTCNGCVKHVTDALTGVPGVRKAAVALDAGEAVVTYDPKQADTDALVQAVGKAGYEASA